MKHFLVALGLLIVIEQSAHCAKDPRFVPIAEKELKQAIAKTPIVSPKHTMLIARADGSGRQRVAYEAYTAIWKKVPRDASANLRRGIAAQSYWRSVAFLPAKQANVTPNQKLVLFAVVRRSLAKAVELNPRSADALASYGFFLWQYDNRMDQGLELMKKAVKLAPKNARVRSKLGDAYSNPSGNTYNPKKAEQEFALAMQLDPSWSYPRWNLILLNLTEKRYTKAQSAMRSYLNVVPSFVANAPHVKQIQIAIDDGIKGR